MLPQVDLAIVFKPTSGLPVKTKVRQDVLKAQQQYTALLQTLQDGGLYAVGKRGETAEQIIILVWCSQSKLTTLVKHEQYSDFLYGLSTTNLASVGNTSIAKSLSASDRLRIIYTYVSATKEEGGLGIIPGLSQWDCIDAVIPLHDYDFNHEWIRSWTTHRVGAQQLDKIRDQFGEGVALYFSFLSSYTQFLIFPSVVGALFYFLGTPYSLLYSSLLVVWSTVFIEWWRIKERILSVRWNTRGSFRVERKRAQYIPGTSTLTQDLRTAAGIPVILLFAGLLASLLTGLFIFEAFVTQLYTGPGHQHIGLLPTILFLALVPRVMAVYHQFAVRSTDWENHAHQSSHEASLTVKTFSMSAIVAYSGLVLSAFVYVPFGEHLMSAVQTRLFLHPAPPDTVAADAAASAYATAAKNGEALVKNATMAKGIVGKRGLWETNTSSAHRKLNPARLQDQMFAFTVTNQVVGTFFEIGLPWLTQVIGQLRGKATNAKKKRVAFEDDSGSANGAEGKEERALLQRVRHEVSLPNYTLFTDYSEMVTQFGYVALWSTIWPLAPLMSYLNNILELRSDAFKITALTRRPVPARTDTIGPWLESLSFLAWLGALTNAALIYLFHPEPNAPTGPRSTALKHEHRATAVAFEGAQAQTPRQLLVSAALVALVASHGFFVLRAVVRHVLERLLWMSNPEVRRANEGDKAIKDNYMRSLGVDLTEDQGAAAAISGTEGQILETGVFWKSDEGLEEIHKMSKDA